ncbi:MAG: NUDIX hydrolase [Bacilli bacterium]|nr:NUDIX hydrolase [Bacilli bacterium]
MQLNNPLYKNIGIHVVSSIFTVDKGIMKVLLIQRTNEPYYGYWALPGGGLYNNELVIDGAKRELKEKTGITDVDLKMYKIFDRVDRSPIKRMIAIAFIGVVDKNKAQLIKETNKTSCCDWLDIKLIPELAYDYNEILDGAIEELKSMIQSTDILKALFPNEFTLPELHQVFESILNIKIDRRNFRKKMINSNYIIDTNKTINYKGKKPAKLYRLNNKIKNKSII